MESKLAKSASEEVLDILVCIKQVPATSQVNIDEKTGVLIRSGIEKKINPYDLYALETALQLKEKYGGFTTAITMGPPDAESIIKESFSMGIDRGLILSDLRFSGADVLSTAFTLSQAIKKIGKYNLIICGKQTTDGDTAQVGSEVAEFLNIPNITEVKEILKIDKNEIKVLAESESTLQIMRLKLPCLICVSKDIYQPRLPSYKKKKAREKDIISVWTMEDLLNGQPSYFGLDGSPTRVIKIFPPENKTEKNIYKGQEEELVNKLYLLLRDGKYLEG